jgi:cell division protein ZapA
LIQQNIKDFRKIFMAQNSTKENTNQQLQKRTFDFKIAGISYKIKTSHDEKTVEELVQLVNTKVSEAMKATKNNSFQNAAVLAALNMAEEMLLLKKRAQAELEKLEKKAEKLSEDIENSKMNKVNWN